MALPSTVPVGQLIPSVYDILGGTGRPPAVFPLGLYPPGKAALNPSQSLSQLGIGDGTLLILAPVGSETAADPVVQAADVVERAAEAEPGAWTSSQSRLAALLIVIALAGTTGLVVVPDGFGAPSLLLGATATAATATIATRATRHGRTTLLATITLGVLIAAAALVSTLFDLRASAAGAVLATMSTAVLNVPGRLTVMVAGLSASIGGDLDPDTARSSGELRSRSARAQQVLTALVMGASFATASGALVIVDGRDPPDFVLAGTLAVLLILRSRVHHHLLRRSGLLFAGTLSTTALFAALWWTDPGLAPWLCGAAAVLALAAIWLGFAPPAAASAPPLRRCLDLLDCLAVAALIPLACWSSGVFDLVRGMSL